MSETMKDVLDTPNYISGMSDAAPIDQSSRLKLVDALRGIAVLGILIMNIPGFSMPFYASEEYKSDPTNINFWVSAIVIIFFEGKMRALFGMIFGASVILFVKNKASSGKSVAWLFYRRMFWLVLFGLIHAHLILWSGDILYTYGFCGMLVYLFRKVKPIYLVMAVPLAACFSFIAGTLVYQHEREARLAYVNARAAVIEGKTPTDPQQKALDSWREIEKDYWPDRQYANERTRMMKSEYSTVAGLIRPLVWKDETRYLLNSILDSLPLMLLGLGLYKWGFLAGNWSVQNYRWMVAVGYGVGIALVSYSFYDDFKYHPNIEANLRLLEIEPIPWIRLIYPFQRILLVLAYVSLVTLLYKSGIFQGLFRRLEAVGQMALTNYVMQSVICTLFFFGYGLNVYGELQYYQLFYVVFTIWALQLIISPLWLLYFRFGPLEWVWRSLTYWKVQPLLQRDRAIALKREQADVT
jgi:uncharacterized protein